MEQWERDLQKNLLQKAVNTEFGYAVPIEDMLEKAKGFPEGYRQLWGKTWYVKHNGKMVREASLTGGEKKEEEKVKEPEEKKQPKSKELGKKAPFTNLTKEQLKEKWGKGTPGFTSDAAIRDYAQAGAIRIQARMDAGLKEGEELPDDSKGKYMYGRPENPELKNINTGKKI